MVKSLIFLLILASTPAWAQRTGVVTRTYSACLFEEDAAWVYRLALQGDTKAASRRHTAARCIFLKENTRVEIHRQGDTTLCVRAPGEPRCLWMTRAFIQY